MSILKRILLSIYMIFSVVFVVINAKDYKLFFYTGSDTIVDVAIALFVIWGFIMACIWVIIFIFKVSPIISRNLANLIRGIGQYDMSDFKFDKEYYREILEVNSPLVLGCLDNFNLDKNKLIAELLYMKQKGIIKIENEKIEETKAIKLNWADPSEQVRMCIKDGKLRIHDFNSFIDSLRDTTLRRAEGFRLVDKKVIKENKKMKKIIDLIISLVLILAAVIYLKTQETYNICSAFVISAMILYLPVKIICQSSYESGKLGSQYARSKKGQELNDKLDGLKRYLKDYSKMSEREAKEIELWEDYLIYSVMFGQNKNVVKEYEKYIIIT